MTSCAGPPVPALQVLLADAELLRSRAVRAALGGRGLHVVRAASTAEALLRFEQEGAAVVVLDPACAGGAALLVHELRHVSDVPVLVVGRPGDEAACAPLLRHPGTWLLRWPAPVEALVARLEALLRDSLPPSAPLDDVDAGPLTWSPNRAVVELRGRPLALTLRSYQLLRALVERAGDWVLPQELAQRAWGDTGLQQDVARNLGVLRRALGSDAGLLQTDRTHGVVLDAAPRDESRPVAVGPLAVDLLRQQVRRDGVLVALPERELALLCHLARPPGRVVGTEELVRLGWPEDGDRDRLQATLRRLRRRIGDDGRDRTRLLHHVRGVGYLLAWVPERQDSGTAAGSDTGRSRQVRPPVRSGP